MVFDLKAMIIKEFVRDSNDEMIIISDLIKENPELVNIYGKEEFRIKIKEIYKRLKEESS